MGNTNNPDQQKLHLLYQQYIPQKLKHEQFGDCTILQSKANPQQKLILKEYTFTDENVFKKQKRLIEAKSQISSDFLLKILNVYSILDKQLCGQFFKMYIVIEYPSTKLDSIKLTQNDYWPIMFGYIRGLETLQKNQITHQQITSKTLFIPPKVCDPSVFNHNSNFQLMIQNNKFQNLYLSPELSYALATTDWQPQYNPYKSDVFTLGMCILQSITKMNVNQCYKNGNLFEDQLTTVQDDLCQKVPQQLADVINSMLQYSDVQRPDFIQLSKILDNKYQEFLTKDICQNPMPKYEMKKVQAVKKPSIINNHDSQNTTNYSIKSRERTQQAEDPLLPLISDQIDNLQIQQISQQPSQQSQIDADQDYYIYNQVACDDSILHRDEQKKFNEPLQEQQDYINRNLQLRLSEIPQGEYTPQQFSLPFDLPKPSNLEQQSLFSQDRSYQEKEQQQQQPYKSIQHSKQLQIQKETYQVYEEIHQVSQQNNYLQEQQQQQQQQQNHYSTYSSQIQDGEYFVNEEYQDGSKYNGMKINGMRHGQGIFYYKDGGYYDGNWEYNHMHGQGILYYSNGKPAYDGGWNQDKFQGYGILYNEVPAILNAAFDYKDFDLVEDYWVKYEGEFVDDNKEGQGTLHLSNGEKFSGQFLKDYINGFGLFYTSGGKMVEGRWINNKLVK